MRKRLWLITVSVFLTMAGAARAQFAAQWNFQDFTQNNQPIKAVYLTPLWNISVNGATNIVASQRQSKQTGSQGSLVVSNMVYGAYRVEFLGPTRTNVFTNCFDISIATNSLVNAADYICVGTNSTSASDYAYTRAQSNQRFSTNVTPSVVGYVATAVDTSGHYDWEPGGGGIGSGDMVGPSSSTASNLVIFENALGKVTKDSGLQLTNVQTKTVFVALTNSLGSAAFQPSTAFPGEAAFEAFTNSLGSAAFQLSSAFISPAQQAILSNNINGANIFGQVPSGSLGSGASISTKFLRGDLTWQTVSGGGGGDVFVANNLSEFTATASTARGNIGAAASATTVTLAGTANQINSSTATAQPLSGNVASTFSLSSTLLLPGTLNVTGDQTNQGNLSVLGNQTNFGNLKIAGNTTNAGTFSVTGNQTNFGNLKVAGTQTNAGTLWVHGNQTNDGILKVVGSVTANSFSGNGANLTSLDGINLQNGTVSSNAFDGGTLSQLFAFVTGADGSGLINLTAANLTGTIPHASLNPWEITNRWQGTFTNAGLHITVGQTNDNLTASTDLEADANKQIVSLANGTGVKTNNNSGGVGWSRKPLLDLGASTNFADTNIVISTNLWNWPGPTNNLDWARGTLQRYKPADTTGVNITNFLNFPAGQVAPVVLWIDNTNLTALSVKLPSPCEATNSLGGLTVSVLASNRLQILFQWSPISTNALFSDQQLIK